MFGNFGTLEDNREKIESWCVRNERSVIRLLRRDRTAIGRQADFVLGVLDFDLATRMRNL